MFMKKFIKEAVPYVVIIIVVVLIRTFIATPVIAVLKVFILFIDEKYDISGKISGKSDGQIVEDNKTVIED